MTYLLKSCPFCGTADDLYVGNAEDPSAWWDSEMRGEKYGYVTCLLCGTIIKANREKEAVEKWNRRAPIK